MKTIDNITVIENITLISINDSPADFKVVAQIFEMLSKIAATAIVFFLQFLSV